MGLQDVNIDSVVNEVNAKYSNGGTGQESASSAPETGSQNTAGEMSKEQAQAILELDKAQKFKLDGREWTPDQLKKSIMLHSDYTKKTQSVAETRKYYDNLEHDLEFIKGHPNKEQAMQMFMETYPKAFHKYLSLVGGSEQAANLQTQGQSAQLPPELMKDLQMVKNYVQERETQAIEAQLDNTFSQLAKKYPEGDEDIVLARAQALLDAKRESEPGFRITNEIWDKLWKASHEKNVGKYEARQKGILEKQRTANQSARGPAPGGGTPGQAPVRMNLKQAEEYAYKTLTGKR
jgi:hypothetical protein